MYCRRNRPAYTAEELAEIYVIPHEHHHWSDHIHRVKKTIDFGKRCGYDKGDLVVDLSCGDGVIAFGLHDDPVIGDYAPGYGFQGSLDVMLPLFSEIFRRNADVFILCETLEHLDNPQDILSMIRDRADRLLVSTPIHDHGQVDENPEHYWTWDEEYVRSMLVNAGWIPEAYELVFNGMGYKYGLWGCR